MTSALTLAGVANQSVSDIPAGGVGISWSLCLRYKQELPCRQEISRSGVPGEPSRPLNGYEARTNKRPMLSDLRESGSIEQDADIVMMIYRDEYYNPDTPDRGITEIIITKHRNGPVGTAKLLFEPQFTRFRNLAAPSGF